MTDAHCHVAHGRGRHFLCDPCDGSPPKAGDVRFIGTHPWSPEGFDAGAMRARLASDPGLCIGEIGLDRLRSREIPRLAREVFEAQLAMAAEFRRPVALHGAKCWGEVVKAVAKAKERAGNGGLAAMLFHGFSRSDGLLPDIVSLGGYVSVGPAVLNDHAVNYRELVKKIPQNRLLVESDSTADTVAPPVEDIAAKLAELRGVPTDVLAAQLETNASEFLRI